MCIISQRICGGRSTRPHIVSEITELNRVTSVTGRMVVHSAGKFDKSKFVHNDELEATLCPTHQPAYLDRLQYLFTLQALAKSP